MIWKWCSIIFVSVAIFFYYRLIIIDNNNELNDTNFIIKICKDQKAFILCQTDKVSYRFLLVSSVKIFKNQMKVSEKVNAITFLLVLHIYLI